MDFNLIVRQTNRDFGFFTEYRDKTEDLTIINLNEKLEPTYIKPKLQDETFVSLTCNSFGDMFILSVKNDSTFSATRYEKGQSIPSGTLNLRFNYLDKDDLSKSLNALAPAETDRNILYLGLVLNVDDYDRALFVGKFDFNKKTVQSTSEVFDRKHAKTIEKNYIPLNNNFDKPNIGAQRKQLRMKYFKEKNGKLVSVISEYFFVYLNNVTTYFEKAFIINGYDSNLKQQFQQLMPVYYSNGTWLASGFNFGDNNFSIVANTEADFIQSPIYGQIDLITGKWTKMEQLQAFDNYYPNENIIWFKDNFILPYSRSKGGFFTNSTYNIGLQPYKF